MGRLNTSFLFRWLCLTVFIFALVAGIHSELFEVSSVVIDESPESQGHEVFQNLNSRAIEIAQTYHHQNIWWVNVGEIARKIKDLPGVKDVIVERVPPQTLRVTILPEAIRLLYVTRRGKIFPITESSQVLQHFNSNYYPDAPITREEKIIKDSNVRAQAVDLVSSLPVGGLFGQNSIAEIEIDSKHKKNQDSKLEKTDFWLSLIQSDVKIKMNSEHALIKAQRVERVLDYTRKHNLHARVIDSEYSKKVVVKLRKDR